MEAFQEEKDGLCQMQLIKSEISFQVDRNVLKLDCGNRCTTLYIYKEIKKLNFKWVSFMMCKLYEHVNSSVILFQINTLSIQQPSISSFKESENTFV